MTDADLLDHWRRARTNRRIPRRQARLTRRQRSLYQNACPLPTRRRRNGRCIAALHLPLATVKEIGISRVQRKRPLFSYSFRMPMAGFLKGEFRLWIERHKRRRALGRWCSGFQPHHENFRQHRDHPLNQDSPTPDAYRLRLLVQTSVIGSTTFARYPH